MQQQVQGWSFTDQHVCSRCVDDEALEAAVHNDEDPDERCDFCATAPRHRSTPCLKCSLTDSRTSMAKRTTKVSPGTAARAATSGGTTWDTFDLVADFNDVLTGDGLVEAVQNTMHETTWVEKNFAWRRRDEVLNESWDRFCEAVRYETRYVLWLVLQP